MKSGDIFYRDLGWESGICFVICETDVGLFLCIITSYCDNITDVDLSYRSERVLKQYKWHQL